jgi:phosphotransferase system enzyme I (PtsP)
MIPMVSEASEMDAVGVMIDKELALIERRGQKPPTKLSIGAMLEVPSLLFELETLLPKVDFISIGSNDLLQFLFAADRTNARVGSRYDCLSVAPLRALKQVVRACKKHKVPLTLCGEMAGRPLEAMALIGLGMRSISMAPASIGPVKAMIRSLNARRLTSLMEQLLADGAGSVRTDLERFAQTEGVDI